MLISHLYSHLKGAFFIVSLTQPQKLYKSSLSLVLHYFVGYLKTQHWFIHWVPPFKQVLPIKSVKLRTGFQNVSKAFREPKPSLGVRQINVPCMVLCFYFFIFFLVLSIIIQFCQNNSANMTEKYFSFKY